MYGIIFHVYNYFSDLHGLTWVFYFNLNFSLLFMRSHFFRAVLSEQHLKGLLIAPLVHLS